MLQQQELKDTCSWDSQAIAYCSDSNSLTGTCRPVEPYSNGRCSSDGNASIRISAVSFGNAWGLPSSRCLPVRPSLGSISSFLLSLTKSRMKRCPLRSRCSPLLAAVSPFSPVVLYIACPIEIFRNPCSKHRICLWVSSRVICSLHFFVDSLHRREPGGCHWRWLDAYGLRFSHCRQIDSPRRLHPRSFRSSPAPASSLCPAQEPLAGRSIANPTAPWAGKKWL